MCSLVLCQTHFVNIELVWHPQRRWHDGSDLLGCVVVTENQEIYHISHLNIVTNIYSVHNISALIRLTFYYCSCSHFHRLHDLTVNVNAF